MQKTTNEAQNAFQLVRAKPIAHRYSVTERCVHNWAAENRIPCVRIGKTVRSDLARVIEALEGGAR